MYKVLIIEDDEIHRKMYSTLMENHGYEIHSAIDGEEGLKKMLEIKPDLTILDVRMPKMDGVTVLKKVREDVWGKNAKVIILTNFDTTDATLTNITSLEPAYYMMKTDAKPEVLLSKVSELLESDNDK